MARDKLTPHLHSGSKGSRTRTVTVLCEAKNRLRGPKCCPVQSSGLKTEWNPVRDWKDNSA